MSNANEHIRGLDSIRFLAALVVAFSHGYGFDFHTVVDENTIADNLALQLYWLFAGSIYNGQAAVIVFFVISGFCIHYPYHKGKPFLLGEFLVRRYLRIGIPLSICLLMGWKMELSVPHCFWTPFFESRGSTGPTSTSPSHGCCIRPLEIVRYHMQPLRG